MNTQKIRFTTGAAVFGLTLAIAGNLMADGYRNPPPTAEGIGKSGVNSVFVDDASAISYNPANLALQTNSSVVAALTFARTENGYAPPLPPGANYESDANWNILPDLYYAQPLGDSGLAVGLGITTPYGQGISWNKNDFANPAASTAIPYEASIMLINFNPTVAFKIGDALSLGVGADIAYSELELKAWIPTGFPPPIPPLADATGDGDGWGIGGNAGLTWNATEHQRLTLTYRSRMDIDYDGDFSLGGDFETTVKYPNIVGMGYGIELAEGIRVEALVEWLEWSVNDTQTLIVGGNPVVQQNNWDDTFTFGVGADWQLDEHWVIRAGYAYIETPVPDSTITPLLPDADRNALSLGVGYTVGGHTIDAAYTFSIYDDVSSPLSGSAPGTYEIDSDLLGLTYSYSF